MWTWFSLFAAMSSLPHTQQLLPKYFDFCGSAEHGPGCTEEVALDCQQWGWSGLILNECLVLHDPQSQQDFKKRLLTCCPMSRPSICKSYDRNHGKFISLDSKKKNSDSFKEDWNSNYWFFKEKKINRGFLPSVQANINFTWLKIFLPLKFKV